MLWTHVPCREIKERQVTFALGNMGVRTFPCVSEKPFLHVEYASEVCLDLTGKL